MKIIICPKCTNEFELTKGTIKPKTKRDKSIAQKIRWGEMSSWSAFVAAIATIVMIWLLSCQINLMKEDNNKTIIIQKPRDTIIQIIQLPEMPHKSLKKQ